MERKNTDVIVEVHKLPMTVPLVRLYQIIQDRNLGGPVVVV